MAWWETLQDEKRPVHTVVAGSRFQDGTLRPESVTGAGRTMFLCTQRALECAQSHFWLLGF